MDQKYKIKYTYRTGNSFNICEAVEYLELIWTNTEIVKKNLQRIKEHYEFYCNTNSYFSSKTNKEYILENINKDWFVKQEMLIAYTNNEDDYFSIDKKQIKRLKKEGYKIKSSINLNSAQSQLIIYTDSNKPFQFFAPWCGYFEKLLMIEGVLLETDDNDLKITFANYL